MSDHVPRRRFGQHFLHDPSVIGRILKHIEPRSGEEFLEIGPGRGALTGPLLDAGARVTAVEIDRDLASQLEDRFADRQLRIHRADALKFDIHSAKTGEPLRLVGNLPYNISTPLLFHFLAYARDIRDMFIMVQKEVATRICAPPGGKDYGRLTVALAARCDTRMLFTIKPGAFSPPPRVQSAMVHIEPRPGRLEQVHNPRLFDQILRTAFSARRKQLGNALGQLVTAEELMSCSIEPSRRPETLTPEQFVALANALHRRRESMG